MDKRPPKFCTCLDSAPRKSLGIISHRINSFVKIAIEIMVQCAAKLRDGSRCTIAATFPKARPVTCRMPAHIQQVFHASIAEGGPKQDVAEFTARKVSFLALIVLHWKFASGSYLKFPVIGVG